MKITFFTPHIDISGGVKIILGYADRLAKKGHKVTVVCLQPTFIVYGRIKGVPILYPKRAIMNLMKHKPYWIEITANMKYIPSHEERYIPNADIIVTSAWHTAPYIAKYSFRKGKKFYLIQHYESGIFGSKEEVDATYTYPLKKIVVANWLKIMLREEFNENSEVLLNPIDLDVFYPSGDKRCNVTKRICMLHHTYNWKGISDGLKAFEITKQAFPNIQLVMFGAHEKEVEFNCEYYYRPLEDELREVYNSCDIFLCPSWSEGFGLPSAEAMACKCALVTTENGGCRDFAIHEKTALVSPPKNPAALAENLNKLLGNEELLKKIAQNGYEYVKQFTWERAVNKMEELFLEELKRDAQ